MKIDLYTKTVLTVIAVCLSLICVRNIDFVQKAFASGREAPMPVALYVQVSPTPGATNWVPVMGDQQIESHNILNSPAKIKVTTAPF